MKISFLLILGTCLQVSASLYSQDVRLDIAVNKMSVKDVLKMVENKSTYRFFYSDDFSVLDKLVSLHVENSSLDGFLDALLQNTNASYKVLEKNIVVISPFSLQQQKVTGKVVDANTGEPIVGANIVIEGTTLGTVTDADGSYSLDVARPNAVLVVSFIGFMTERINYTGQSTLEIKLVPDIKNLEEVVVVGYGVQKKTNLTGAVGSVDGEMLEARPVQNASQMLQGMIPGLNITQSSGGSMENKASINIRGTATIGSGSTGNPLVLIDGMEGDINAINPQDIENISVLKDVAASSIYGSRAPFGVILVTTKKGKQGRTVVNYNNSLRWSSPINMPDMMDSYTFALYFNDAYRNGGSSPFFSDEWLQRIKDYQDGKIKTTTVVNPNNTKYWKDGYGGGNDNVDWYDALYRNYSFAQEHNLSATGGNERTQYYFSGNILDQDGLMEFNQDKFKRYTGTVKITSQLSKWISANVNSRFVREDYGRPSNMSDGLFQDLARQGWPILPLYDPNGFLYSSPSPALGLRDGGRDKSQKDWLYEQVQLIFEPIKGWRTFGEFNYRINDNFRHWDIQKLYNHDVNGDPYEYSSSSHVYEYGYRENFFSTNIYTEYSKDINDAHHFKGMLGFQNEKENYRDLSATNYGITVSSIPALDATSGIVNGSTVAASVSGQYQKWSTAGFFGRLNYDYKGRYLLEANLRYDGTSRFRENKRWNLFPSFSAGWNIAREDFWAPLEEMVSTLKLRASYGELGNQNTDNWYPTYVTMPVKDTNGSWLINGVKPTTSSAPSLISSSMTWERVNSWNIGLDMAFLRNRLTSSFDYYTRYTLDMIGPAPQLPDILGTDVPKTNNTDLKTYGFEFSLGWKDRLKNDLGYSVNLLLSDSQTEITRYPNKTGDLSTSTYREGQKMGEIWGYETVGIAKDQPEMDAHLAKLPNGGQDALGSQWSAGDIMYKDLNEDGKIDNGSNTEGNPGDLKIIGNSTARYLFSIDLNVDWKGFDARAFFQGVLKRDYFQDSYYFWGASSSGVWWSTGFKQHEDYYRADASHPLGQNIDSYYPRPLFNDKNQQVQSRYLQDASYIRLKNLQLGYTLPQELTSKIRIDRLRVFVAGENLWTGTKMTKIFDPETISGGYGGNVYPLTKVFSVGLNVNF